jgi:hypothetical protein
MSGTDPWLDQMATRDSAGVLTIDGVKLHTFPELVNAVRDRMLEDLYPDEANGTHERTFHADLPQLSEDELKLHNGKLRLRLFLDPHPSPWLIARGRALEAERVRRGG